MRTCILSAVIVVFLIKDSCADEHNDHINVINTYDATTEVPLSPYLPDSKNHDSGQHGKIKFEDENPKVPVKFEEDPKQHPAGDIDHADPSSFLVDISFDDNFKNDRIFNTKRSENDHDGRKLGKQIQFDDNNDDSENTGQDNDENDENNQDNGSQVVFEDNTGTDDSDPDYSDDTETQTNENKVDEFNSDSNNSETGKKLLAERVVFVGTRDEPQTDRKPKRKSRKKPGFRTEEEPSASVALPPQPSSVHSENAEAGYPGPVDSNPGYPRYLQPGYPSPSILNPSYPYPYPGPYPAMPYPTSAYPGYPPYPPMHSQMSPGYGAYPPPEYPVSNVHRPPAYPVAYPNPGQGEQGHTGSSNQEYPGSPTPGPIQNGQPGLPYPGGYPNQEYFGLPAPGLMQNTQPVPPYPSGQLGYPNQEYPPLVVPPDSLQSGPPSSPYPGSHPGYPNSHYPPQPPAAGAIQNGQTAPPYPGAEYPYYPGYPPAYPADPNSQYPVQNPGQFKPPGYPGPPGSYWQGYPSGQHKPSRRAKSLTQRAVSAVAEALTSIALYDDKQCVPRLLCEVAGGGAASSPTLATASASLQPLLSALQAYNGVSSSPLFIFGRAAVTGMTAKGNPSTCYRAYPQCPTEPEKLISYLNNHNGGFFRFFGQPEKSKQMQNLEQFYSYLAGGPNLKQPTGQNVAYPYTYGYGFPGLYPHLQHSGQKFYQGQSTYRNAKNIDSVEERIQNKPGISALEEESDSTGNPSQETGSWSFPEGNTKKGNEGPKVQIRTETNRPKESKTLKFPDDRSDDRREVYMANDYPRKQKRIFFPGERYYKIQETYQSKPAVLDSDEYVFDHKHNFYVKKPKVMKYDDVVYIVRGNGDPNHPEIVKVKPGQYF